VRAITPRVQAMLRRGTKRLVLRARLAIWRVRYRIRILRLVGSGTSAQVEAGNSPTRITNRWFHKNRAEIFRMVRQLAQERYRGRGRSGQPAIAETFENAPRGEVTQTEFGGQQRAIQRSAEGEGGDFVFGTTDRGGRVRGESYGPIASRVQAGTGSSAEAAAGIQTALRGEAVTPDIADLAALSFGGEVFRSRIHGGTAEVTSRLALAGLQEGTLSVEEVFGTEAANTEFSRARRRAKQTGSTSARTQRERARRATGGLLPQTQKGHSTGRAAAIRLTEPGERSPGRGTQARRFGNETINRTVELVARIVGQTEYSTVEALKQDIIRKLDEVDRGLTE